MPADVHFRHEIDHTVVAFGGTPDIDEFLSLLQEVGGASVAWPGSLVVCDLRGIRTAYSFTEQLRVGEAVGRNFAHLVRVAAVVAPERITRVGEKVANRTGARSRVFATEADAVQWLRTGIEPAGANGNS